MVSQNSVVYGTFAIYKDRYKKEIRSIMDFRGPLGDEKSFIGNYLVKKNNKENSEVTEARVYRVYENKVIEIKGTKYNYTTLSNKTIREVVDSKKEIETEYLDLKDFFPSKPEEKDVRYVIASNNNATELKLSPVAYLGNIKIDLAKEGITEKDILYYGVVVRQTFLDNLKIPFYYANNNTPLDKRTDLEKKNITDFLTKRMSSLKFWEFFKNHTISSSVLEKSYSR